ncbi:hypothetical protein B0T26DRAFT_207813 [Lasiosphaeria miniovina]|uniref:Uncharacterized protein n=1 Tax=Lasiosphaeria miniovina TaxID=1954250 RepID=A0AA40AUD8_9PEZI|nr:uncharacterized protein B0T26DRAFT_207813 [Lasiosphaeria miniovina]KAK0722205.1 hypothetical protein B0T26DRAFT_207813 [Lasiosphaeria miniovina]
MEGSEDLAAIHPSHHTPITTRQGADVHAAFVPHKRAALGDMEALGGRRALFPTTTLPCPALPEVALSNSKFSKSITSPDSTHPSTLGVAAADLTLVIMKDKWALISGHRNGYSIRYGARRWLAERVPPAFFPPEPPA